MFSDLALFDMERAKMISDRTKSLFFGIPFCGLKSLKNALKSVQSHYSAIKHPPSLPENFLHEASFLP